MPWKVDRLGLLGTLSVSDLKERGPSRECAPAQGPLLVAAQHGQRCLSGRQLQAGQGFIGQNQHLKLHPETNGQILERRKCELPLDALLTLASRRHILHQLRFLDR